MVNTFVGGSLELAIFETTMSQQHSGKTEQSIANEQRSDLRTRDGHYSARGVYHALHCPYPGTDVLRAKERQRAHESSVRVRDAGEQYSGSSGTCAGDASGERGVSL